jgi:integrase
LRSRYWRQSKLGETFHTFGEAGERWLAETSKRTIDKDRQRIAWFNEAMSDVPLREINREMLDAARARLIAVGLSKHTANHYLQVLRGILRKAYSEWQWLDSVPKFPMFKLDPVEPRWVTREQFRELVKHLPAHTADLARFAVATGLRKSNITGLTWDRVDMQRRVAYVPAGQAKAGRGIPVALNADALAVLKRWRGRDSAHVFVYRGQPITQVSTKAWRRACREAGLSGLRFHDLRHSWASWHAQAETPLSVLQALGGWQSASMVQRYAHLSPGHLAGYADRTELGTSTKGPTSAPRRKVSKTR